MLDDFIERLGDVLFDLTVLLLRLLFVVMSAKLALFLLGGPDTFLLMFSGLKILLL